MKNQDKQVEHQELEAALNAADAGNWDLLEAFSQTYFYSAYARIDDTGTQYVEYLRDPAWPTKWWRKVTPLSVKRK